MSEFKKEIKVKGHTYVVKISQRKNKKYTAWLAGPKQPHPEIKGDFVRMLSNPVHFGDKRYNHYKDQIGYYKSLDTNDLKQRERYRKRHAKDNIHDPKRPGFWAYNFLW
jgi:hypothetical protein